DDDQVDFGRINIAVFAQTLRGGGAEIAGRLAFFGESALADPGSFKNPFVRGIYDLFKIFIGDSAFREVVADCGNLGATYVLQCSSSSEPGPAAQAGESNTLRMLLQLRIPGLKIAGGHRPPLQF